MMQPDGSNNVARGWYIFPYPEGQVGILSILHVRADITQSGRILIFIGVCDIVISKIQYIEYNHPPTPHPDIIIIKTQYTPSQGGGVLDFSSNNITPSM